jgi:hypothetical protein
MAFSVIVDRIASFFTTPIATLYKTSPRKMLLVNNLIMCFCSLILCGFAMYVSALFYKAISDENNEDNSGWLQWVGQAIIGICMVTISIVGMRGAHLVSLELLLTYFWGIVVFLAPLLLGTVGSFLFSFLYIDVYVRHRWSLDSFAQVRNLFCPSDTADSTCACPLLGGPAANCSIWCISNFDATNCDEIRNSAENDALTWGKRMMLTQGSIGIFNCCQIFFSMWLCYKILTSDVITQSMNDIINYLLIIPITGCIGVTIYLSYLNETDLHYKWILFLFITIAAGQCILIPLGVLAGRLKNMTMLSAYIVGLLILIAALITAGSVCLFFSVLVPESFQPSPEESGDIACNRNLVGCCCCDDESAKGSSRCPEWTADDVVALSAQDLKVYSIYVYNYLLSLPPLRPCIVHRTKPACFAEEVRRSFFNHSNFTHFVFIFTRPTYFSASYLG